MKIASVNVESFRYRSNTVRDSDGHGHPGPEHDAVQSLLTITTDDGASGGLLLSDVFFHSGLHAGLVILPFR